MKTFTKLFATAMFVTATLLLATNAVASQDRGNSTYAHEAHKKNGTSDRGNSTNAHQTNGSNGSNGSTPISVPEAGTLVLLTAAASVAGLRMLRGRRRPPSI